MAYPSIQQYQEALQHPATAFTDPVLASGNIAVSGLGVPRVLSGGFALTYAVEAGGKKYAVRCFHREAKGLEGRYEAISKKLRSLASPYFLDFEYQHNGVRVGGATFPVVKMAWANGETLGEFIERNHSNAAKVKNLIDSLNQLASFLEHIGIAHGDIQDLNLVVAEDGRKIQLIDYDGMYVPELASLGGSELGHRDYQHPRRDEQKYDSTIDRFSFIALSLALRALSEKPSLWRTSQSGAGVIVFRANDYADPASSAVLAEIATIQALTRDARNFASICTAEFASIPTLAHFTTGTNIPVAIVQVRQRPGSTTRWPQANYISAYPVLDAVDYAAFERRIGQMVELVGKVVEVKVDRTRGGKPFIFINFANWRGKAVKITLWSEALVKGGEQPSKKWVGQWVTIRGLVEPVYISRKYNYQHISITANAVSQMSHLTEAEAKYRLSAQSEQGKHNATNSNNSAVLNQLRGSSQRAPTPVASSGASMQARPSASRNQDLLQQMQGRASIQKSPARHGAPAPTKTVSQPTPRSSQQPIQQAEEGGLWSWLKGLFK